MIKKLKKIINNNNNNNSSSSSSYNYKDNVYDAFTVLIAKSLREFTRFHMT